MGELDGIARQVQQHLTDTRAITRKCRRHAFSHDHTKPDALVFGAVAQKGVHRLHHLRQRKRLHIKVHVPGLNFGEVENVIDDGQQRFARGGDVGRKLALLRVQRRIQQQVRHADHTIHGGANLMAHGGQKNGFAGVGLLRRLARCRTLQSQPLQRCFVRPLGRLGTPDKHHQPHVDRQEHRHQQEQKTIEPGIRQQHGARAVGVNLDHGFDALTGLDRDVRRHQVAVCQLAVKGIELAAKRQFAGLLALFCRLKTQVAGFILPQL